MLEVRLALQMCAHMLALLCILRAEKWRSKHYEPKRKTVHAWLKCMATHECDSNGTSTNSKRRRVLQVERIGNPRAKCVQWIWIKCCRQIVWIDHIIWYPPRTAKRMSDFEHCLLPLKQKWSYKNTNIHTELLTLTCYKHGNTRIHTYMHTCVRTCMRT